MLFFSRVWVRIPVMTLEQDTYIVTIIASLHPGVNGYLWGQRWFMLLISLVRYIFGCTGCILLREQRWFKAPWPGVVECVETWCIKRYIKTEYYNYYYWVFSPLYIRPAGHWTYRLNLPSSSNCHPKNVHTSNFYEFTNFGKWDCVPQSGFNLIEGISDVHTVNYT